MAKAILNGQTIFGDVHLGSGGGGNYTDSAFDLSAVTPNYYIENSGAVIAYNGWSLTDYIPVGENTEIIVVGGTFSPSYTCCYDSAKNVLGGISSYSSGLCGLPTGTAFVRISSETSNINAMKILTEV